MAIEVRIPTILRTYTDGEKAVTGDGGQPGRADRRPRGQPPRHQGAADRGGRQATCAASSTSTSTTRTSASSAASRPSSATATRSSCCPPSPAAAASSPSRGPSAYSARMEPEPQGAHLRPRRRREHRRHPRQLAARTPSAARGAAALGAGHRVRPSSCGASRSPACSSSTPPAAPCPSTFVQALLAMDYRPVPLSGRPRREGRRHRHPAHARRAARHHDARRRPVQPRRRLRDRSCERARRPTGGSVGRASASASSPAPSSRPLGIDVHDLEDDVGAFNVAAAPGARSSRSTTSTRSTSCADRLAAYDVDGGSPRRCHARGMRYDNLLASVGSTPLVGLPRLSPTPTSGSGPSSRTATRPARSRTAPR